MIALLVKWAVYAGALMLGARMLGSVKLNGWGAAFGGAAAFGVANVLLGWLLTFLIKFFGLPLTILTLGLFLFLVPLLVNMVLLKVADAMAGDDFEVNSVGGLFGLSLFMSGAGFVAHQLIT